jgi:hypothetical protein
MALVNGIPFAFWLNYQLRRRRRRDGEASGQLLPAA